MWTIETRKLSKVDSRNTIKLKFGTDLLFVFIYAGVRLGVLAYMLGSFISSFDMRSRPKWYVYTMTPCYAL